jgi:hypothetical protein
MNPPTPTVEAVKHERQKVYGDPLENHRGIAQAWAGILQPWHEEIRRGEPVPPHVVALLMAAMKMNRMRRVYHADNFTDLRAYLDFAQQWQEREKLPAAVARNHHRIYLAHPYSAATLADREMNVHHASLIAAKLMALGHDVHSPLNATHPVEQADPGAIDYERWMRLDFGLIERWATAIYVAGDSPGVRREVELARSLGLVVWTKLDEVPTVE